MEDQNSMTKLWQNSFYFFSVQDMQVLRKSDC